VVVGGDRGEAALTRRVDGRRETAERQALVAELH
jgi:hypothetical protein